MQLEGVGDCQLLGLRAEKGRIQQWASALRPPFLSGRQQLAEGCQTGVGQLYTSAMQAPPWGRSWEPASGRSWTVLLEQLVISDR